MNKLMFKSICFNIHSENVMHEYIFTNTLGTIKHKYLCELIRWLRCIQRHQIII